MSRIEGIGNLNPQIQQFIRLDGLAGNAFFQGLPFQDLHDDEGLPFMLTHVVDGADGGMIPGRCNSGFSLEPLQGLVVLGKLLGQELQGRITASCGCPRPCRPHPFHRHPASV